MICVNCGDDSNVLDKWRLVNKSNLLSSRIISTNEIVLSLKKQLDKMTPNTKGHKIIQDIFEKEQASLFSMRQELKHTSEQLEKLRTIDKWTWLRNSKFGSWSSLPELRRRWIAMGHKNVPEPECSCGHRSLDTPKVCSVHPNKERACQLILEDHKNGIVIWTLE